MVIPRKWRLSRFAWLALILANSFLAPFTFADTITVTNSADAGPGTLRQAIADSVSGDAITFDLNDTNTIALTSGQLLITNNLTIISSNAPIAIDAGGASRVLEISAGNTVVLDSLILTNGNAADAGGGVLLDDSANVTLTNCIVSGNVAGSGGALFISSNSAVVIANCIFSANGATNYGGAIDNEGSSTLTIVGSILTGNSAQRGGAIFNDFGTNVLNDCTLSSNYAANGGAIDNDTNSVLTVNYSMFAFNFATNFGGGLINTNGGTVTVNNSTFASNSCPADWGGGIDNWDTITLNNCTLSGNQGSGFINTGGKSVCNNCTFSGNSAIFDGGGYYTYFGTNILNNCTISGNSANRRAGGIYENSTHTVLTNTIVAGNTAILNSPNYLGVFSGANNLFDGNPLLAPLGDYGGPTQTMPPLFGSPAINAGADSVTNLLSTDQRGYPRLADIHLDIGAAEIQPAVVMNTNDDGPGSFRAAIASGAELIAFTNTLSGGTIVLTSGQLIVSNSVGINASGLSAGILIDAGGASRVMEIASSNVVLLDSLTITNGNVSGHGGGILVDDNAAVTLTNCIVAGNSAGTGGGISVSSNGAMVINHSSFLNNTASDSGGGAANFGSLNIYSSTFAGNNSGGLAQIFGTLLVNNSTISKNTTSQSGGGVAITGGEATLNNCTLVSNSAGGNAGAIAVGAGVTNMLNNCTIAGNSAGTGGGIYFDSNSVSTVINTIVAGNNAVDTPDIFGPFTGSNNLTNGNPLLAPLGNYGGPTQTMPPVFGSPAIDGGLDFAASLVTDQRGFPRISGAHVDIGAVEAQFAPANNRPFLQLSRPVPSVLNFTFFSIPNADFTILSSTNLSLPLNQWDNFGQAAQTLPGLYHFSDSATNKTRYYQVVSP